MKLNDLKLCKPTVSPLKPKETYVYYIKQSKHSYPHMLKKYAAPKGAKPPLQLNKPNYY